jgi:hypothetical protein
MIWLLRERMASTASASICLTSSTGIRMVTKVWAVGLVSFVMFITKECRLPYRQSRLVLLDVLRGLGVVLALAVVLACLTNS